ncbi:hypothetical protein RO21_07345 [[Actinobacillus] muris]|uniref:Autotransporter domain-containing protein n=1 Tax=Muribacter muris TaxID=67855 RepID=A0A0J5P6X7_9PAST|nr:autotransporter outer membrane beta-barrel domain-containing protein [Muribacter muris]KMK51224.1 hypothetical protein RO21_07345 [[Actinobacillus] muris] [Muribacter muris]
MNHKSDLWLKGLKISAIATAVASASVYAYEQGKGATALIHSDDKVEKIDTLSAGSNLDERIKGDFNRSGNPVRVIWYGNPSDQDGKVPQTGANNQGQIIGKVIAKGLNTTDSEDRRGAISIDGVANGIDALGWSAPSNPNDVIFNLNSVENSGSISASTDLQGCEAETHGDIQSYGSGNGISVIGLADFGKHNAQVGSDGIADGYSGATGVSRRTGAIRISRTRAAEPAPAPSSPALEKADFEGKTVEVGLQNVNNSGQISGKIYAQAHQKAVAHTSDYKPQFYSVTGSASGNALSISSYVNTIDRYTYSENKHNFAKLGSITNSGHLRGEARLLGGKNTTHTGTASNNSGNGISAIAVTGRFAKNSTEAAVGNLQNSGEIAGRLEQISGDNSGYRGFHLYSTANAHGSGNAVSVTASSANAQTRVPASATLGDIQNSGKMTGSALVKAGGGLGDITANVRASGNGVAVDEQGNSGELAKIGIVDNTGVISGQIEVYGGKSDSTATDKRFIPEIKGVKTAAGNSSATDTPRLSAETCRWLPANTPGCETAATPTTSSTPDHVNATVQSATGVHSSGNGITAWTFGESSEYGQQKAQLGNVLNTGTVSGYAKVWQGFSQGEHTRVDYRNNGAGIAIKARMEGNITNAGVISGNHSALLARGKIDTAWSTTNPTYTSGFKGQVNNYGILAGRLIVGGYQLDHSADQYYNYFETRHANNVKNAGLYIQLDKDENIEQVTVGTDSLTAFSKNGKNYTVINAPLTSSNKDSEKLTTAEETFTNKIINGVGMANGALFAKHNTTLEDSIVNGYKTALKVGENVEVTVNNTTLNANGFKVNQSEKPLAILGDSGANKVLLSNSTLINGDIDLKAGNDELTIADGRVKFNGRLIDLGEGLDTLQLGKADLPNAQPIKVDYEVHNAEQITVNQPTTFWASAKVRGTNTLTLNSDLHYQVLSPEMHALFDANRSEKIALNGVGKFIVDTTKAASEYEVKFGGFQLEPTNITFETNSVLQNATFKDGKLLIQPKVVMTAEEAAKQAEQQAQLAAQLSEAQKQKAELEKAQQDAAAQREQEQAALTAQSQQLEDAEKQKAELEKRLQDTLAQRDQLAADLAANSVQADEVKQQKAALEKALQQAIAERDQLQANAVPAKPSSAVDETKTALINQQLADLQQKIDQLNQQIADQNLQAGKTFSTPFTDAYQSYLTHWQLSGVNALEASALTTDKSEQAATEAINRYLSDTVEHNIYGAVAHQLAQFTRDERNALLSLTKRLSDQQWYVAAKGLNATHNYRQTAEKATTNGAMVSVQYGVNDDLTAGAYIATHQQKTTGGASYLKGKGVSFGAYVSKHFNNLSLTAGVMHARTDLEGKRYISNGYDSHQFDANGKANATGAYLQAKYAVALNDHWQFVPRADVAYTRLAQGAINETGDAGLAIDAYRTQRIESRIGQDMIAKLPMSNGNLSFKISTDYTVVAGEKDLQGRFNRGQTFAIRTEPNRNIVGIGAGIGYEWRNGLEVDLNASKALSKAGNETIATFKLGYTFK